VRRHPPHRFPPAARRGGVAGLLGLALAATAGAQPAAPAPKVAAPPPVSLARYVPREGLAVYLEFQGLDRHAAAWKQTAAAKLLGETGLGAMLTDLAAQAIDQALARGPGPVIATAEVAALADHLVRRGFVVGYCGKLNPPDPRAAVLVVRDGARNPTLAKLIPRLGFLTEPAARPVEKRGGRKVLVNEPMGVQWWTEGADTVIALSRPDGGDPVLDALDGKVPSAADHPARAGMDGAEGGFRPIGLFHLDVTALPAMPAEAVKLGLDGIKAVDYRWGVQGETLVSVLGIAAPRPRRGVLALLDQPALDPRLLPPVPAGVATYTLISLDPVAALDQIVALSKASDPADAPKIDAAAEKFRDRTGLRLREDLLARVGPRMAFYSSPIPVAGGGGMLALWFHPPRATLVAEVKDPAALNKSLDRLAAAGNRELKALGSAFPGPPPATARPGADAAEFRKLRGGAGYVLAVPPGVFPTPATLRPTVALGRTHLAIATAPGLATAALAAEGRPADAEADRLPPGTIFFSRNDPREGLPELLANLPAFVQVAGAMRTANPGAPLTPGGPRPGAGAAGAAGSGFRIRIDPDAIPDVEAMRRFLFPGTVALAVDEGGARLTTREAFPYVNVNITAGGTTTPVLVALLLPAVQAAREAARRAQCTNNLKQIGLALHNYQSTHGRFPPAASVGKDGKPLLSWRVALLPFLEQQALYERFHLDEPWDSPHNKELLKLLPSTYACPSRPDVKPGTTATTTTYRAITGKGAAFEGAEGRKLADFTDGLSNTLMVVESRDAVPWTAPDDLTFDPAPDAPLPEVGSAHPGGFNALFGDGSTRFIKASLNPATLRALMTRAGGEVVNAAEY